MISIATLDYLRVSQPLSFSLKKNAMATVFPKSLAPSFKIFGSLVARKFLEWSMSAHFTGTLCKTSLCHSMPSLGHLKSGSGRSSCSDWVVQVMECPETYHEHLGREYLVQMTLDLAINMPTNLDPSRSIELHQLNIIYGGFVKWGCLQIIY